MPALLLRIPQIQSKISETAERELTARLGVPVRVGNIDIAWFNHLVLEDLYLADRSGRTLFEANRISAGFELLPLLEGKIVFTTVRLFGFSLHLSKTTPDAPLNLQFVIDAFAGKDTTKKSPNIDLRLNTVLIRKGNLRFDIESATRTPGKFNPRHVAVSNLSAKISLKAFNKDSLNANIKKMSFTEASGFELERLMLNLSGNRDSLHISNFEVRLPHSDLRVRHGCLHLPEMENLAALPDEAPVTLDIAPSQICLKDLSAFVPAFTNFTDTIELSAEAGGYINDIDLAQLTLKYSDKMLFVGKMNLRGITHPEEAYLFGQVNKMYITTDGLNSLADNFSARPVRLPDPLVKLGTLNFTGEISGFFDNLVAFGKLSSAIGSVQTDIIFGKDKEKDISLFLKGNIQTSDLHLHEIFGDGNPYGDARLAVTIDARRPVGGSLAGDIRARVDAFDFKGYRYENLQLAGSFKRNAFDGSLSLDDPNGRVHAEGYFRHEGKNSLFNFTAAVDHFRPDSLHLTDRYEAPDISFALSADFSGDNIDNLEGNIRLEDLAFRTAPSSFFLKKLEINASGHAAQRRLEIRSDLLNGEVSGAYSFATIVPSLMNTLKGYVPALINATQKERQVQANNFDLLLTIENTEALSNTLKLPFTLLQQGRITGQYDNSYNKFRFEAWLPRFMLGKSTFEAGHLSCDNPADRVNLALHATNYNDKGRRNYLDLKADAADNRLNTLLSWANNKERTFKADFSASAAFTEEERTDGGTTLLTEIALHRSPLIVNDTLWEVEPSEILVREGKIAVDSFRLTHGNQYLAMDGIISKDPVDTLNLDLNKIELSYVFDILNIPVLQFAGEATGKFNLVDLFGSRILNTDLEVEHFAFNQTPLGRLNLFSEWDDTQKGIMMLGSIYTNDTTWTDVNGYVYPVGPNAGLSLHFDANDLNIGFISPFIEKVIKGVRGRGFGKVHLHGPFKALNVEGDAYVQDGGVGIEFTNTYYTFSDSVHMDSTSVNFRDVTLRDKYGNAGKLDLRFNHKHFHDFDFRVDVQAERMLLYDATQKMNPLLFGSVFASGTGRIAGNGKLVDFEINMQSEPKSHIILDFMNNNTAEEYDFITFIDRSKLAATRDSARKDSLHTVPLFDKEEGAELRMNFQVDLTPDATIELIMDPVAGDRIKGNASGNLQVQYGTKTDLRMYGGVNITEGNYNFSLQKIIHKDFKIRDGSTIDFHGDPFNANMNINAIYNLTANLSDLDQGLAIESPRANVPVNCVLKLDGLLRSPAISFDIELPGSNEELERQVKSLVDTDDMMTRQIVYLLVLNKFYTPDYTNGYRSNDFNAVASSAISSQLSSLLNSITDKVQIGANIRAGQENFNENMEMEMLLSSQLLDNRLLINGNFGYKNSYYASQKNVFVGEFDLEYKLTKSGEIRLKAYNHANDMYQYLKQSLTTQGVGILFKKDFTRLSDIFRRRRLFLPPAAAAADTLRRQPAAPDPLPQREGK